MIGALLLKGSTVKGALMPNFHKGQYLNICPYMKQENIVRGLLCKSSCLNGVMKSNI